MTILLPCHPLDPREVDPDIADQATAADVVGFATSLVLIEALVEEAAPHPAVRLVPKGAWACSTSAGC